MYACMCVYIQCIYTHTHTCIQCIHVCTHTCFQIKAVSIIENRPKYVAAPQTEEFY